MVRYRVQTLQFGVPMSHSLDHGCPHDYFEVTATFEFQKRLICLYENVDLNKNMSLVCCFVNMGLKIFLVMLVDIIDILEYSTSVFVRYMLYCDN